MGNHKIQGKFSDVPLDEDTAVLLETEGTLDPFDILYQAWLWDGTKGESVIFLSADVSDMSDDELKTLVRTSPLVHQDSELTMNDRSGEYTFVNFNFGHIEDDL